ncbi:WSC domain-containing protein [Bisporella sp. PMI_857]|nr:WSC domain-containing protein [Bisporella sp. PMI_857]
MRGIIPNTLVLFLWSLLVSHVASLAKTDTITWGGDNSRTGYQDNHNMDPTIVASAQFGQIFRAALPGVYNGAKEQIFSMPLVYTLSDGVQYIFLATTHNNVYKLDAKTGTIIAKRNLHIPFLVADLDGCVDINPLVGVTATGVIDPDTETYYITSKTYANQAGGNGAQGLLNGRYYIHAISLNDLSERPNFPVALEGTVARNNPVRTFGGGIHHQRPGLLHSGQYIYAGFASHCVHDNFTGWIIGWDKDSGAIVERFATQGLGVDSQTKGAGVWMSGGGLASDNAGSMFFSTGNGYASQLSTIPVNGRNPPTSLEEAAVHMSINTDGTLTVADFFMPWEKTQLDGADRDLGTTPLEILPSEFACGDYKRIGVLTGKSGKTYFLNLDDLGGYQNGPNKLDDVIYVYQHENSVYAGAGVYPGEGGYIYINVINYPSRIFKFSCVNNFPTFTVVARTPESNAFSGLGVSHGTTTSLDGAAGTGLFWLTDVNGYNLRIYNAVPSNGYLTLINKFNIPGVTKFSRPVFGNGRAYIATNQGYLYGFGAPVNQPLNCSAPYEFGTANLTQTSAPKTITCKSLIAQSVSSIAMTGNPDFAISNLPTLPFTLANGGIFSLSSVFNPTAIGVLSSDVVVTTSNNLGGYSLTTPISLRGTGQSVAPLLAVSPVTVAFQGLITGQQPGGVNQTMLFLNNGNTDLTISTLLYSQTSETGPYISPNDTSAGPSVGPFTFYDLPTTIPPNSVAPVTINFDTSHSGNFATYVTVKSDGGNKIFDVVGTAGDAPKAVVEFQTPDGLGWVTYSGQNFTFGNVTENQTRTLKMRITNNATTDSAALSLTISKAPFGSGGLISANNQIDLAEGTTIAPGQNATASIYCSVPKTQWNTDSYSGSATWEINFNDLSFGHQKLQFVCNAVAEQSPPLLPNGNGQYRYVGCFLENNPGRQLKQQLYGNDNSTTNMCIAACAAGNYVFCGTQYNRECWGGPTIPNLKVDERNCDYPCKGDVNQICGGNGFGDGQGKSYISLFADSKQFNGNTTSPTTPSGPVANPGVNGYTSIGCYTEATTGRALSSGKTMTLKTVANCVTACAASSFKYAGLEYGQECWCGNAFGAGSVPTTITDCKTPCADNSTEYCGAGSRLNVYQFGASSSSSSVSSQSSASLTSVTSQSLSLSSSSLPTSSTSLSSSSSAVQSSVSSTTTSPSSSSSDVQPTISVTSTSLTSTSSTSSAAPTQSGPAVSPQIDYWTFLGCYTESDTGRALSSKTYANDNMTLDSCGVFCKGYAMFGVEYGRECYCGNTLNKGSVLAANQADCKFLCPGNKLQYCGAGVRLQLYAATPPTSSSTLTSGSLPSSTSPSSTSETLTSTSSVFSSTTLSSASISSSSSSTVVSSSSTSVANPAYTGPPVVSNGNVNFTYYSCATEPSSGRLLPSQILNDGAAMTIEKCLETCWKYAYAGVEYGRECWCGNTLNVAGNTGATPSTNVSDSLCSFTCPGNSSEFCGSGGRLNLYWFDQAKADRNSGKATLEF